MPYSRTTRRSIDIMKRLIDPVHPHYASFVESARRYLVRYGIDRDEAVTLASNLTQKGFALELDSTRFKRFADDLGLVVQTLQLHHLNNQVKTRIYEVDGRELAKEVVCFGFTCGGAIQSALDSVETQRAAALQFYMKTRQGYAGSMSATDAEVQTAGLLEKEFGTFSQHPDYPAGEWIDATEDGKTDKPYWQWVAMRLESIQDDESETSSPGIA